MKTQLKLTALLLLVLGSFIMNAQTMTKESILKQVVQSSKAIFEGKIISEGKAYRAKNNAIYTEYDVQIEKMISGNVASQTIKVIIEGGQINEDGVLLGTGSPHGLSIQKNVESTIFVQPTINGQSADSYMLVEQVCYTSGNQIIPTNHLSEYYTNINDLYNDLSKELNIKIAQKKNAVASEINNSNNIELDLTPYAQKVENYNARMAFFESKKNNTVKRTNNVLANNLTISTGNEVITSSGGNKYLEFDVFAKANVGGLYFDNCLMRLQYSTTAFGSNLMASGNVTITKGTLFNSATYLNPQTNAIDQTSNTLGIPFGIEYTQSTFNRTVLGTTDKTILHIKIKIQNCGQTSDLQFVDVSTTSNLSFFTTTANANAVAGTGFDNTTYVSPATNLLCTVIVDDYNSPVHGGRGDIFTITGSNFGATRGNGKVRFRNANNGAFPFLAGLDNNDYISWTNTEIKIKMPSSTILNGDYNNPGSGAFIVKNNLGDSTVALYNSTFSALEIDYSIDTRTYMGNKFRVNLKNQNGLGGYTVRLDTSISNYPDRKGCVIKAIKDWRCVSAANLVLGTDTFIGTPTNDKVTTIAFKPSLNPGVVATTFVQSATCASGTNTTVVISDFDTQVSRQFSFFYDTTGMAMPTGMYDFYEVVVHEIGHGLGLIHVIDTNQIMYYTTKVATNGISLAGSLRRRLAIYTGDADGALYQVTSSASNVTGQCTGYIAHQAINTSCVNVGIDEAIRDKYKFNVYPNPTNGDMVYINFDTQTDTKANISVLDVTGRVLYSSDIKRASENEKYTLNLNGYASGLYFINLRVEGQSITQKVIKN